MSEREAVESHGTPLIDSKPVKFPCQGPGCGESVLTDLTDEDVEVGEHYSDANMTGPTSSPV